MSDNPNREPTAPGYYWAKLVRPSQMPDGEDWVSYEPEIVHVWENYGEGDEVLGVDVFGVPETQWPKDFIWLGPVCDSCADDARPTS